MPDSLVEKLEEYLDGSSFLRRVFVRKSHLKEAIEIIRLLQHQLAEMQRGFDATQSALLQTEMLHKAAENRAANLAEKLSESEMLLSKAGADVECLVNKIHRLNPFCREVLPLGRALGESKGKTRGRRILLVGWYGAQNFGDELMLRCMLQRFATVSGKDVELSVLIERNDRYRFINIPKNVRCFYPPETETDLLAACNWFDEIVLGGGAHIDDAPIKNFDFIPYLMIRLSQEALNRGKTVRWISVSSNRSLQDPVYLEALRKIAARAATFSVRDAFSLDVLREAGVPNVTLDRDIAFDVEPLAESRSKVALVLLVDFIETDQLKKVVGDLFDFFAERMLHTNELWQLCFLPFYLENSNDRSLYERLLQKVKTRGVPHFIAEEIESAETMLMLFKSADLALSMRYHGALLADIFNVPNLVLCPDLHRHYFNKMHALSNAYPKVSRLIDISAYTTEALFEHLGHLSAIRTEIPQFLSH